MLAYWHDVAGDEIEQGDAHGLTLIIRSIDRVKAGQESAVGRDREGAAHKLAECTCLVKDDKRGDDFMAIHALAKGQFVAPDEECRTPVAVGRITNATAVSAGGDGARPLLAGDHVDCWGNNSSGQSADGPTIGRDAPVAASAITSATTITVGADNACAPHSDGSIDCCGGNQQGEL